METLDLASTCLANPVLAHEVLALVSNMPTLVTSSLRKTTPLKMLFATVGLDTKESAVTFVTSTIGEVRGRSEALVKSVTATITSIGTWRQVVIRRLVTV